MSEKTAPTKLSQEKPEIIPENGSEKTHLSSGTSEDQAPVEKKPSLFGALLMLVSMLVLTPIIGVYVAGDFNQLNEMWLYIEQTLDSGVASDVIKETIKTHAVKVNKQQLFTQQWAYMLGGGSVGIVYQAMAQCWGQKSSDVGARGSAFARFLIVCMGTAILLGFSAFMLAMDSIQAARDLKDLKELFKSI
ncbi:hypothetical protein JCM33374_g1656 [Metschnikowia sp. JCM 33374]|nr:hypothetical protein JCM33374_g1656 [Metschnikowia sp. JCM 33374]